MGGFERDPETRESFRHVEVKTIRCKLPSFQNCRGEEFLSPLKTRFGYDGVRCAYTTSTLQCALLLYGFQ